MKILLKKKLIFILLAIFTLTVFTDFILKTLYLNKYINKNAQNAFIYNSILGWTLMPNSKLTLITHFKKKYKISSDNFGFRNEINLSKKKKSIWIFGDSISFGYGINSKDLFSDILNSIDTHTLYLNYSMNGFGTDQAYITYNYILNTNNNTAETIIYFFYPSNDIEDNSTEINSLRFKPLFNEEINLINSSIPNSEHYLNTFSFIRNIKIFLKLRSHIIKSLFFSNDEIYPLYTKKFTPDIEKKIVKTQNIIKKFSELSLRNNCDFILIYVPDKPECSTELWNLTINLFKLNASLYDTHIMEKTTKEFAEANNIKFISLREIIDLKFLELTVFFENDSHFNELGHKMIAETILHLQKKK